MIPGIILRFIGKEAVVADWQGVPSGGALRCGSVRPRTHDSQVAVERSRQRPREGTEEHDVPTGHRALSVAPLLAAGRGPQGQILSTPSAVPGCGSSVREAAGGNAACLLQIQGPDDSHDDRNRAYPVVIVAVQNEAQRVFQDAWGPNEHRSADRLAKRSRAARGREHILRVEAGARPATELVPV